MEEQFVTYEIALKLQGLGFNEDCIVGRSSLGIMNYKIVSGNNGCFVSWMKKDDTDLPLPLWQQAIDWLRNMHGIHVFIFRTYSNADCAFFGYQVDDIYLNMRMERMNYGLTYIQAREQSVLKAIEIVKCKQL